MKIGLVLDDTLDTPDGVQQYVLSVGGWLSEQGHDVHYLVGQTERTDIPNIHVLSRNVHVKFNGNRMSIPLPVSRKRLKIFLNEQQFDILHVQVPYSPFLAGRLLMVAPARTAVIGTFHVLPYSNLVVMGNRLLSILNRSSGKRFDRMLAVSSPARHFAESVYHYQAEVVPNPVRLAEFDGAQSDSQTTNIVFLGRLVARKGVQQLLQAVKFLRDNKMYTGDYRVIIGGKGELTGELSAMVETGGLEGIVSLEGYVEEADKPSFLAQADIAVYPSLGGESFGIVLLEAMAAARGVVLAGNNPGYTSVMQPYPEQLFDPMDTKSFAEKLAWYLDHPMARARAVELQRGYVHRFDIGVVGQELLEAYTRALQSRPQS